MNDYLDLLLERTTSGTPLIRPRLPSIFEPETDFVSPELPVGEPGTAYTTHAEAANKPAPAFRPNIERLPASEQMQAEEVDVPTVPHASITAIDLVPGPQGKLPAQADPQLRPVAVFHRPRSGEPGSPSTGSDSRYEGHYTDPQPAPSRPGPELSRPADSLEVIEPHDRRSDVAHPTPLPRPVPPANSNIIPPKAVGLYRANGAPNVPAFQSAALVTVRIGRIDIRVAPQPGNASPRKPASAQRKPVMSLDHYLAQRSKEKS